MMIRISGFRRGVICDFTQRRMVVSYRRFGTPYRYHLHSLDCVKSQKSSDLKLIRKWGRGIQENENWGWEGIGEWGKEEINEI